jgi:hypothetical protein
MSNSGKSCRGNDNACLNTFRRHSGTRRLARARNPYSRPRLRLDAFAEKTKGATDFSLLREWPRDHARRGYGFRALASRAPE